MFDCLYDVHAMVMTGAAKLYVISSCLFETLENVIYLLFLHNYRAVYEGNDHEKFLDRLENRIKQHDRDIEKMCNFHYQGFIESIQELVNVRSDAERLKVCWLKSSCITKIMMLGI